MLQLQSERLGILATRLKNRGIEMIVHSTVRKIQAYNPKIINLDEDFEICADVSKVYNDALLSLENPSNGEQIHASQ